MLTTRDAARLLLAAAGGAPLASLTARLGFADPLPLTARDLAPLTGADPADAGAVAAGDGTLRALLVDWASGAPLRERVVPVARRLAHRAPGLHWLVVARHRGRGELLVAAPAPGDRSALPALVVDASQLRESDAETLAVLAAEPAAAGGRTAAGAADSGTRGASAAEPGDAAPLRHLRWREVLGRDALSRRFYRDLEGTVARLARSARGRAGEEDRRTIALLTTSRLLFLAFLEAKGWLDGDRAFLRRELARTAATGPLHARFLEPLCFGTLNTPVERRARAARAFGRIPFLNGGLFQRSALESRCRALRLDDDAIAALVGALLPRYRLTARETSADLSDAAVDPEMLGRAFESLMAPEARGARGTFYTPPPLIAELTRAALDAIARHDDGRDLATVRLLDPACGSGAFLVHALEVLAARRIAAGDTRGTSAVRREVLTRCIFGVDVDPVAVWLCQLRLWLAVVVEDERDDPMRLPPLPNLDRNVRQGDALAGRGLEDATLPDGAPLAPLRLRYARASGTRKRTLARALDLAERRRATAALEQRIAHLTARRRELLAVARAPDLFATRRGPDAATRRLLATAREELRDARTTLRRLRDGGALPFSFATHFPEVAAGGGFDLVVGNPPWVRPHAVAAGTRAALRERFETARHAAWEAGAEAAGAGRGFAAQADLAALFTERAVRLTRPGGVLALLLPSKLWRALAGGGVRELVRRETRLLHVHDWPESSAGFEAVVYPSAIVARRTGAPASPDARCRLVLHHAEGIASHEVALRTLGVDDSRGAPWLLVPAPVREAFDRLVAAGVPLAGSAFGRALLGVKTGCNAAFVVEADRASGDAPVRVRAGTATGLVEAALLRPLVRGEQLRAWTTTDAGRAIVWTHAEHGPPLERLPPATARWLGRWRRELESRSDARGARWWTLFRTEAARADRPRVVWADIGRAPRAVVLPAGDPTVPLNTCYVVRAPGEDDAHALAALLNSRVAAAWLAVVAEPARGGYRRFLGWTVARLPLPRDWDAARAALAPIGRRARVDGTTDAAALDAAVLRAYGLDAASVAPLLAWSP